MNNKNNFPWISVAATTLMIFLYFLQGPVPEFLVYKSATVQATTLISTHFVHSDIEHLLLNTTAFLLLGSMLESLDRRQLILSLLVGITSVNTLLLSQGDSLIAYAGLSGVLNTVFIFLLVNLWRLKASPWLMLVLFLAILKIAFEWTAQVSLFSHTSWAAYPPAHFAGLMGGIIYYLLSSQSIQGISRVNGINIR